MTNRVCTLCVRVVIAFFVLTGGRSAAAQTEPAPAGGRVVQAVYVPEGLTVDGRLDEPVYARVQPATGFIQQEPDGGQPVTEKTDVWVLFDDRNVYVSVRMWDSHPERMIANDMRRDGSDIYNNENFSVSLDTFHDRRTAVYFMTNILGARRDAQVTGEAQLNGDWNPIWLPKAQRFERGWTLEIEIPFKSIRYPSEGEQVWGIQFRRVVRWKNEVSYLTAVPPAVGANGILRMSDAATLEGLRTPAAGKNLEIKPYGIARSTTDFFANPRTVGQVDGDFGLDAKYGVTQGLTADFTYNTDFAQVEDDLQQVNLTRFNLQFPEKREFFLEGQGIFTFGAGGADAPVVFFSRQIGLSNGRVVPIRAGGRLTGKEGKYTVGLLNIESGASTIGDEPATNFSAVRIKRDILGKSAIGFIVTERAPHSGNDNTAFGADANFGFGLTTISSYIAKTRTPGLSGRDASYYGQYNYNADRYGVEAEHLAVGDNFNPQVGFFRRRAFRKSGAQLRFSPRPKHLAPLRKVYYETSYTYYTNLDNRLESRALSADFKSDLNNGDQFTVLFERDYEFLARPFQVSPGKTIPVGGYGFHDTSLAYTLGGTHRVRGTASVHQGSFYNGDRYQANYSGRIDLTVHLAVEPTLSANWVDLPSGNFQTTVVSNRTTYSFSPLASLAALVQYNSTTNALSSNVRFRWEYTPGSDLFVVYNEGRTTNLPDRYALQNRTFVLKLTHLFRY